MSRKHTQLKQPSALRLSVTVNPKNFVDAKAANADQTSPAKDWYRGYLQSYAEELAQNPEKYADVLDGAGDFLCELRNLVGFQRAA